MSDLLSPEQLEEVEARLRGDEPETPQAAAEPEEFADAEASEDTSETTEAAFDDPDVESGEEDVGDEDGHSVPYTRFSKVIAAKNRYAEQVSDLEAEIEALHSRAPQSQPQAEPSYHHDDDFEDLDDVEGFEEDPRISAMEAQMRDMAVRQEEAQLEQELDDVAVDFPNVEPEFLLNAVIQDPEVNIRDLAESYTNRVAEIEEAAVADYLALNPDATASPDVPPEVSSRTRGNHRGTIDSGDKPKTMEEAHSALEKWLEAQ